MELYIVFTDTKTNLAKMIKNCTGYPFSHVSLSFSKDLSRMYSFGRKEAENAFIGGFVKENVRDHLFQRADCAVCKLHLSEESYRRIWEFVQRMEREQDLFRYNFTGLFAIALNYNYNRKNAYFCSQFVAEALAAGGVRPVEKPHALITPRDLFSASDLNLIYRGVMREYPYFAPVIEFIPEDALVGAVQ